MCVGNVPRRPAADKRPADDGDASGVDLTFAIVLTAEFEKRMSIQNSTRNICLLVVL